MNGIFAPQNQRHRSSLVRQHQGLSLTPSRFGGTKEGASLLHVGQHIDHFAHVLRQLANVHMVLAKRHSQIHRNCNVSVVRDNVLLILCQYELVGSSASACLARSDRGIVDLNKLAFLQKVERVCIGPPSRENDGSTLISQLERRNSSSRPLKALGEHLFSCFAFGWELEMRAKLGVEKWEDSGVRLRAQGLSCGLVGRGGGVGVRAARGERNLSLPSDFLVKSFALRCLVTSAT